MAIGVLGSMRGLAIILVMLAVAGCGQKEPKPPVVQLADLEVEQASVAATSKNERYVIGRMVVRNFGGQDRLLRATAPVAGSVELLKTIYPPPPAGPLDLVPPGVEDIAPVAQSSSRSSASATTVSGAPAASASSTAARSTTRGGPVLSSSATPRPAASTTSTPASTSSSTASATSTAGATSTAAATPASPLHHLGAAFRPRPLPIRGEPPAAVRDVVRAEFMSPEERRRRSADANKPFEQVDFQGVEIPPGGEVVFRPGGYQIRFVRVGQPLPPGTSFPVHLVFQRAGTIVVPFNVRTPEDEKQAFPKPSRRNPYLPADKKVESAPVAALVVQTVPAR